MSIMLSLICPIYKVKDFIPSLIDSFILGINVSDVEVIFVDDCCPQGSMQVCRDYLSKQSNRIKFSYQLIQHDKNTGQAVARNTALPLACGNYIGFIDSDDIISVNYWLLLESDIKSNFCDIIEFGYQEFQDAVPIDKINLEKKLATSSPLNPYRTGFFIWTRIFKKKLLNKLTFPVGVIFEDIYFSILAYSKAKITKRYTNVLVYYRKREGSTTSVRTSNYSFLLRNLIDSTSMIIPNSRFQKEIALEVAKYSLLVTLKGIKIDNKLDRRRFYHLCDPMNRECLSIFNKFGNNYCGVFRIRLAILICVLGKLL